MPGRRPRAALLGVCAAALLLACNSRRASSEASSEASAKASPEATSAASLEASRKSSGGSASEASTLRRGLSPLAPAPDWSELDRFQETMSRQELVRLLDQVYTQGGMYRSFVSVSSERAVIRTSRLDPSRTYELRLAPAERNASRRAPADPGQPLAGLRVAIDPGHIGGQWGKLEWRWFRIRDAAPVVEGDLNLRVARLLARRLEQRGAEVTLVRSQPRPVTDAVPRDLEPLARALLVQRDELDSGLSPAQRSGAIHRESVRLAYRTSEIRARAALVDELQPDLTICVHFDAVAWDDPVRPTLVDENHVHAIVHGSYTAGELELEDMRFHLMRELLSRNHEVEMALSREVTRALAEATGLPPKTYPATPSARQMSADGYIWARNLLANRLYRGPVLYLEAYVMNDHRVFARIQAGDYPGLRYVAGARQPSIFREYADAVTRGLVHYYRKNGRKNGRR